MRLILASNSASRRAMLDGAGVPHEACAADVDESAIKQAMAGQPTSAIALALAQAKAMAVSALHPGALVLGGDSMVSVAGQLYSKPKSREDAALHLCAFSGRPMQLYSAAALARGGVVIGSHCDEAQLDVRHLGEGFIAAYLETEWPAISGCVGCFRIESMGVQLFDRLTGSHFTILGMPLLWVLGALRQEGYLQA
jgi:septum formation protein